MDNNMHSFGGGGGGMGGGWPRMIKTFQRAVGAGLRIGRSAPTGQPKKRPTSSARALTVSSSPPLINLPISTVSSPPSSPPLINLPISVVSSSSAIYSDDSEWECVDGIEDETAARVFYDDCVFETVPSKDEVERAVSALQQVLGSSSEEEEEEEVDIDIDILPLALVSEVEVDWIEPSQNLLTMQHPPLDIVYNAFHLLETDPLVRRMVVSLSSDKAVWDAIMNNEVVKELRGLSNEVGSLAEESSNEGDRNILRWIVTFAKEKIMQLLDNLMSNAAFKPSPSNRRDGGLDERMKSSFFLSIVVVIIVILARTKTRNAQQTKTNNSPT